MVNEICAKLECENPKMIIETIKHDDLENNGCKVDYSSTDLHLLVKMTSQDLKTLQKTFNAFSQRFKLATDTYKFCIEENQKSFN